jgi:Zn-dependent M16 (insulinase) family peptidase
MDVDKGKVLHTEIKLSVEAYCRSGFYARRFQNLRDMIISLGFDDCKRFGVGLEAFKDDLEKSGFDSQERLEAIAELEKDLNDRKTELSSNFNDAINVLLTVSRLKEGRA